MSFLIIPVWPWGQINVKRASDTPWFSERYNLVPTFVLFGLRFTWRKWV